MNISSLNPDRLDFEKSNGLLPAIIQDSRNGKVLMLGYMNRQALDKTLELGLVTFFSRSKNRLWTKGEESGNTLSLVSIHADCDCDALLLRAKPAGPTCHRGTQSCFDEDQKRVPAHFLETLEQLLQRRRRELPEGSYTSTLFKKGIDKIAQKVGEEAVETIIEAKNQDSDAFIYEASDLVFHLLVLCVEKEITLMDLVNELEKRHQPK